MVTESDGSNLWKTGLFWVNVEQVTSSSSIIWSNIEKTEAKQTKLLPAQTNETILSECGAGLGAGDVITCN